MKSLKKCYPRYIRWGRNTIHMNDDKNCWMAEYNTWKISRTTCMTNNKNQDPVTNRSHVATTWSICRCTCNGGFTDFHQLSNSFSNTVPIVVKQFFAVLRIFRVCEEEKTRKSFLSRVRGSKTKLFPFSIADIKYGRKATPRKIRKKMQSEFRVIYQYSSLLIPFWAQRRV